jgi:lysine 2,3-aminomutase
MKPIRNIQLVDGLSQQEKEQLQKVTERFSFSSNDYYLSLIDWKDKDDPIRRIIIPNPDELEVYGDLDVSREKENYVASGCQHKYTNTAVLLVVDACAGYCRFCFRKRLFRDDIQETTLDVKEGLEYIAVHPEIDNVLLTGGDPLILSPNRLEAILKDLREIPHVKIIRIGSKVPAYNPMRIYENQELLDVLSKYSYSSKRIYVMTHFNHPLELTAKAHRALDALQKTGVVLCNQTPILKGVNDDSKVLSELMNQLSFAGVAPYYFFINRPVIGNSSFEVSIKRAYNLVEEAKKFVSGLAKRVRLVMSHATGKIEILHVTEDKVYLKYHQAKDPKDYNRLLVCNLTTEAAWFDDLLPEVN